MSTAVSFLPVSASNSGSAKAAEKHSVEPNIKEPVMHSVQFQVQRILILTAVDFNQNIVNKYNICLELWCICCTRLRKLLPLLLPLYFRF